MEFDIRGSYSQQVVTAADDAWTQVTGSAGAGTDCSGLAENQYKFCYFEEVSDADEASPAAGMAAWVDMPTVATEFVSDLYAEDIDVPDDGTFADASSSTHPDQVEAHILVVAPPSVGVGADDGSTANMDIHHFMTTITGRIPD